MASIYKKLNGQTAPEPLGTGLQLPSNPIIQSHHREYSGFFNIDTAVILQENLNGTASRSVTRLVFERGDAAAVVLHDSSHHRVVLVRQLRYPVVTRGDNGWILEIVAGAMAPDDDPRQVAIREILEETGLDDIDPRYLFSFYLSPGGASERCHLFSAPVDLTGLHGRFCGEPGTDEDIRLEVVTLQKALKMILSGEIIDAKTIIALQWLWIQTGNSGGTDC